MRPNPAFSADQYDVCYRAYAATLLDLQKGTLKGTEVPGGDQTCLNVALSIIEASVNGMRDVASLKQFAIDRILARI